MKRLVIGALLLISIITPAVISQVETVSTIIDIHAYPDYVPEPIKIVGFNYGNKEVKRGEDFQATLGWIKDLSVKVKNVSSQTLKYVEVSLNFPHDQYGDPILTQVFLSKGFGYMLSEEIPTEEGMSILPGEEVNLSVSKSAYEAFALNVKSINPSASVIRTVKIKAEVAAFSPTRVWVRGAYLDRDPQNPKRWVVDQQEEKRKLRHISQIRGSVIRKVGFNPLRVQTGCFFAEEGCFLWDDSEIINCGTGSCTGCTISRDKIVPVPFGELGWRPECILLPCRKIVNGQIVTCPGCNKRVVQMTEIIACVGG